MTNFTDNFDKLAGFSNQGFEPVLEIAKTMVDASEKLARQNYAFFGDVMDFAVAQARLPLDATDPKDIFDRQVNASKAFANVVSSRVAEYAEIGKAFQQAAGIDLPEMAAAAPRKTKRARKAA